MLALTAFFTLTAVVCGQYVRPYTRYNPRYQPQPLDYRYDRNPEIRDWRLNALDEHPKPYSFSYSAPSDVGPGQSSRQESADGSGRVQGTYSLTNEEGHTRVVDYVADEAGFRANIRTDEPGTVSQNPADVVIDSTAPLNYAAGPYAGPYARPYAGPYGRRPFVPPVAHQPVLNALEAPGVAPLDPAVDPAAVVPVDPAALYRRPPFYAGRNYYRGAAAPYNSRGYLPNYRSPYDARAHY